MLQFNYFGLKLKIQSECPFFDSILKLKYKSFKNRKTYQFEDRSFEIDFKFSHKSTPTVLSGKKLSNNIFRTRNTLLIKHSYLTTETIVCFHFKEDRLIKISLDFNDSFLFKTLNAFTRKIYLRQLNLEIFKKYIEQPLLWEIARHHQLRVLHASAVTTEEGAIIFAGLNGVGKTTLALSLISSLKDSKLISDNYLLIDRKNAYLSPDTVRVDRQTAQKLGLDINDTYGFNKFILSENKLFSDKNKLPIKSIFLIDQGDNWKIEQAPKNRETLAVMLDKRQQLSGEEVFLNPVSLWTTDRLKPLSEFLDFSHINFGKLIVGTDQLIPKKLLEMIASL